MQGHLVIVELNSSLFQGVLAGVLLGLSIAAPPGPVSALIAQRVSLKKSWAAGFSVGLGALTADALFLFVTYLGWTRIASQSKIAAGWVYLVGGLVLFLYASLMIMRHFRDKSNTRVEKLADRSKKKEGGYSYILGLTMGLSNPYQIAWWLTVGLASISYFGSTVVIGFFGGIVLWIIIFSGSLRYGTNRFSYFDVAVLYGSTILLCGFAVWFLYTALRVL